MTDLNERTRQAARNVLLTVAARIVSVATPIIFAPLLYWVFGTIGDTKDEVSRITERVQVLERNDLRRDEYSRQITQRRDDQINEIVQRLARVEEQSAAMVAALNRLTDRLDREQRRGDLLGAPDEPEAAQK